MYEMVIENPVMFDGLFVKVLLFHPTSVHVPLGTVYKPFHDEVVDTKPAGPAANAASAAKVPLNGDEPVTSGVTPEELRTVLVYEPLPCGPSWFIRFKIAEFGATRLKT